MRFRVVRMRDRGFVRDASALRRDDGVVGELLVTETDDKTLRRSARVAQLVHAGDARRDDLLPPLVDPVLLWMAPLGFVLAGMERDDVDGRVRHLAQSWWVRTP
jgi:hypothetical protein